MKTGDIGHSKICECHANLPINKVLRSLTKFLTAELCWKFTKVRHTHSNPVSVTVFNAT